MTRAGLVIVTVAAMLAAESLIVGVVLAVRKVRDALQARAARKCWELDDDPVLDRETGKPLTDIRSQNWPDIVGAPRYWRPTLAYWIARGPY